MEAVFIKLLNMSITASYLVLAVILLRLIFKKAPKSIICTLWGLVAIRLVCPFSFESAISLIPSVETVPQEILYTKEPTINSGIGILNNIVNPIISESLAPNVGDSVNPMQVITYIVSVVWGVGIVIMLFYAFVSYAFLYKKTKEGVELEKGVWICDRIDTPFVLGVIKPRIFLPSSMNKADMEYVIAHEKAHLKRHDHWWKPLGFALLTIYWFNLVMWLAYVLLCRDIEYACDERVIKEMGTEYKKSYSSALINCSIPRRMVSACPLAFGEVGVKSRIKSVLNYKKPAFWVIFCVVAFCALVAITFLTNPFSTNINNVVYERGYEIIEQENYNFTITIPKNILSKQAYTSDGQTFKKNEVIVFETDTTTVYLEKAMISNETDDLLYLMFNYTYHDIDKYENVILPYRKTDDGFSGCVGLESKHIQDQNNTYEDTVKVRGYGPNEQFAFYASTDVIRNASEFVKIEAFCNQLTYQNTSKTKEVYSADGEPQCPVPDGAVFEPMIEEKTKDTNTGMEYEIGDLLYREWQYRDDYFEKGSYTIYKDILLLQVSEPEKILFIFNDELEETIEYNGEDIKIDISEAGICRFIAVDKDGVETDITPVEQGEINSEEDNGILFLGLLWQ